MELHVDPCICKNISQKPFTRGLFYCPFHVLKTFSEIDTPTHHLGHSLTRSLPEPKEKARTIFMIHD
jgi:hypothetical protein